MKTLSTLGLAICATLVGMTDLSVEASSSDPGSLRVYSDLSADAKGPKADCSGHRFQKVTSLQARVQGDMPQWNADKQRFVSEYYSTFDTKYRAVLDTVNMAAVEGALKYVQAECINKPVIADCKRKNNIKYVVFYQTTVVQPAAS
ncbi:hypothetical protein PR003_g30380, partial [Phytophthora rubi]